LYEAGWPCQVATRFLAQAQDLRSVPFTAGWHKHGRNMNVLVEPRFTAGTGSAFNENFVRLEKA
jgi:hypothetical protein